MISVIDFEAKESDSEFRVTSWLAHNHYDFYRSSGHLGIPRKMEHMITHVIITGGPQPSSSCDNLHDYISTAQIPVLGICLGCMGIVRAFSGALVTINEPQRIIEVHGKPLIGNPDKFEATAAHREKIVATGDVLRPFLWHQDEVVGVVHPDRPIYGVMFHPESPKTTCGNTLLSAFLSL